MNKDKLIATIELSPNYILGFSLVNFKGTKYASITKFSVSDFSDDPKPMASLTLDVDKFKEMVVIIESHLDELLDPVEKEIAVISLRPSEILLISVSSYKEKFGIDIRKYIIDGEVRIPTKKGVRVPIEETDSLEECLRQLSEAIDSDL